MPARMITAMLAATLIAIPAFAQQLPDDVNNAFTRGLTLGSQGQHEEALSAFREAVRLKPDFAEGHRSIGFALASLDRYEEALSAYQEAVRLNPDFAEAYINIATVLAHQSRYAEGLRAYQEAVRLKPDLAKTYFDLEEALKTQETKRITDPTRRLQFESFSVLPPSGENWFIQNQGTDNVHFSKGTTRGEYHTVTALARSSDTEFASWANRLVLAREGLLTEQLLSLGAKIQEQQWQDSRYKPLEARVALDSSLGKECMRFDFTAEDRGVPYAPGSVFVLTAHDLYCLHPDSSTLVVPRIHVRTRIEQSYHCVGVAFLCCIRQGCAAFLALRVHFRSGPEKELHGFGVAHIGSPHQGRRPDAICCINFGAPI